MPSDERKHVGPDSATPRKHDTARGILLRIIRGGGTPGGLISIWSMPSCYGSVVISLERRAVNSLAVAGNGARTSRRWSSLTRQEMDQAAKENVGDRPPGK